MLKMVDGGYRPMSLKYEVSVDTDITYYKRFAYHKRYGVYHNLNGPSVVAEDLLMYCIYGMYFTRVEYESKIRSSSTSRL